MNQHGSQAEANSSLQFPRFANFVLAGLLRPWKFSPNEGDAGDGHGWFQQLVIVCLPLSTVYGYLI